MILDFASTVNGLLKFRSTALDIGNDISYLLVANANHPFIVGESFASRDPINRSNLNPNCEWDFSASPDKPGVGDTFEFRFSRIATSGQGTAEAAYPNQWIIQFKDASGNILGGLQNVAGSQNTTLYQRNIMLVAMGNSNVSEVFTAGSVFSDGMTDHVITCQVTATHIIINFYAANNAQSMAGTPPVLFRSVSAPHAGNRGPVTVMGLRPIVSNSALSDMRGADRAVYVAGIFGVNEDLTTSFVANVFNLTATGATLVDLPLLSTVQNHLNEMRNMSGFFYQNSRDLRRSMRISPQKTTAYPSANHMITDMKFEVEYAINGSAIAVQSGDSDLEFFTRFGGVNYSQGRFGKNAGVMTFTIDNNPGTGTPYASYTDIEIGIVLREKV